MGIFDGISNYGHEELVFGYDEKTGLRTIIGIHSTAIGPAVGGTRFWNYDSEEDALFDVLRLSRGMTLKNAAAGLKIGGGKGVIIGDPKKLKSKEFFHAYGKVVNSLNGTYYTAEDVNINTEDIGYVGEVTKFVTGTHEISGNPSPFTARGVFKGMKAGAQILYGSDSLKDMVIAVQGLGSVGYALCDWLHKEGAKLKVFDINSAAVEKAVAEFGATAVAGDEILKTECDFFAPCALGAVINTKNAKDLNCKIICGAANNVLLDPATGEVLEALNILYLPDYIVNAGGIINCEAEVIGRPYKVEEVNAKVDEIYDTTIKIVKLAKEKNISTYQAAEEYAEEIVKKAKK